VEIWATLRAVNRKLTDQDIESTWRTLEVEFGRVSGRQLREALRLRFGTPGRTDRVFGIWRTLSEKQRREALEPPVAELLRRMEAAEVIATEAATVSGVINAVLPFYLMTRFLESPAPVHQTVPDCQTCGVPACTATVLQRDTRTRRGRAGEGVSRG